MTSLEPKIEKSRTWFNFDFFSPTSNLTSNFEIHNNLVDNFFYLYKYIYTFSIYVQSMKKNKGTFDITSIHPITSIPYIPSVDKTFFQDLKKAFGRLYFWKVKRRFSGP